MSTLRLPRTIRLDPSDTFVFERAAEPGEWAVTGSFLFTDTDPAGLSGKTMAAFRSGFVGVRSFGFSTLVVVSEATEREMKEAVDDLARHIRRDLGAPSDELAREAAREELAVAASLCGPAVNSVLAMHRTLVDGELREQFRLLAPRPGVAGADRLHLHARAFALVEVDEEEPVERVDLVGLAGRGMA
ncbi:DUF6505 family protein [uncultured Enterovirga sp.]|uniref:DUF6505 family protein n=1 Tax=uncultured Enterovirga sp. TaxID=2026352 RepID=UPI0035C9B21E